MNKITSILSIAIIALSVCLFSTIQSKAQATKNLAGVVPFTTVSDRLGFLDQTTGRIYIYDNQISNCVFVGQIQELGKTIQSLYKISSTP